LFDLSIFRARHIVKKTVTGAGALVALAAVSLTGAQAAPITIPTGLNPGDTYRLAFVTSTRTDALNSQINYYHNFVNTLGLAATGISGWKALVST